jgi:hypothetical protein
MRLEKLDDMYFLSDEIPRIGKVIIGTSDAETSKLINNPYTLSKANCDEIFGVVDVEKLAYDSSQEFLIKPIESPIFTFGYEEGFNKAIELNKDKLFSFDEVIDCMKKSYGLKYFSEQKMIDNLKSLQQPTEIEVEMIYDRDCYSSAGQCDKLTMAQCIMCTPVYPLKDENGCIILKKKK